MKLACLGTCSLKLGSRDVHPERSVEVALLLTAKGFAKDLYLIFARMESAIGDRMFERRTFVCNLILIPRCTASFIPDLSNMPKCSQSLLKLFVIENRRVKRECRKGLTVS